MMVEAGANEVSETAMLDAIMFGHEYIKKLVEFQDKIVAEIGKEKVEVPLNVTGDDVKKAVREFAYDKCVWVFDTFNRQERQAREAQVKQETIEALAESPVSRLCAPDARLLTPDVICAELAFSVATPSV